MKAPKATPLNGAERQRCLAPTWFLDADHPAVASFAAQATQGAEGERERAVRLYYAVRDGIRYNPYALKSTREMFRASYALARGNHFCIPKAVLLAAAARAVGIPSRVGFADVKNHLSTPKLREKLGTDLFVYHGYSELYLKGRWLKATPTFNKALCARFGVKPLEFDGRADALFHPFDKEGRRHMEYVRDHGSFDDLPLDQIIAGFRATYPHFDQESAGGDFEKEAGEAG